MEWSEDELLTLVISYLEQFTEEQVDWEVIVMQMQQNDFFRSVDESRSTVKQLLLDYKSMYHFEVDDEHISSYIPELQKVFQNEEELDQAILSLEAEHDSTKILWTSAETLVLINLYQKNGKLFKKQKKGAGWERLSKDLHQAGFPLRPCKTIKQKMDNLKRTYKNVFENDAIYMIKSKKFKFYDSLKPIFEKYEKFWLNGGTEPASENEEEDEGEDNLELEPIKRAGGEVKKRSAWKEIETRILIKEYGNSHNVIFFCLFCKA